MAYYAIGIGGTGAKCIESLIHLAAAGLMPDNERLYVLFVDPDKANGSLSRANNLLQCYDDCRQNIVADADTAFLKTPIEIADPDVWARPLLFEMALFSPSAEDKRHPLRQQILGEWRGLLAMLALKEIKNLNVLTAKKVEIKLRDKQPNPLFLEALYKLIPKKTLSADTA